MEKEEEKKQWGTYSCMFHRRHVWILLLAMLFIIAKNLSTEDWLKKNCAMLTYGSKMQLWEWKKSKIIMFNNMDESHKYNGT